MQELEVTWGRVVSVWWLLAWRATLGAVLLGAAQGFIEGAAMGAAGASLQVITLVTQITGAIIGAIWFFLVVRMALRKHYKEFRIALVPRT
jgi:uncharacterized membrane protein YdjX (TVP38/TMEM64 family)